MSPAELDELRLLTEAATPGPWDNVPHPWPERGVPILARDGTDVAVTMSRKGLNQRNADAEYIAALSPDVVLHLIQIAEAAMAIAGIKS